MYSTNSTIIHNWSNKNINSIAEYNSVRDQECSFIHEQYESALTIGDGVSFELNYSNLSKDNNNNDSRDQLSINSSLKQLAVEGKAVITYLPSTNLHQHLSTHNKDTTIINSATSWLELSCTKYTLDNLVNAQVIVSFTIIESEIPLNNEGAIFERGIITKIVEEIDNEHIA